MALKKTKYTKYRKKGKKAVAMPFQWIFSIIVGAVILFLAFFATSKFVNLQRYKYDTELAAKLSILLNPVESSIASAVATRIDLPFLTRLQLSCKYAGIGRQDLKIVTKSSIGEEWQEYGASQNIYNKYIFSRGSEGKTVYVFSKQFELPFKIADLIYLAMNDYCFVNAPDFVLDGLKELNMSNVQIAFRKSECKKNSLSVCFQNSACDLNVYGQCFGYGCSDLYDYGFVENRINEKIEMLYYVSSPLMYAAIFSDAELYKCNVNRLMYRLNLVSRLYAAKSEMLDSRGCGTGKLRDKLFLLSTEALSFAQKDNIQPIQDTVKKVDEENSGLICRVF